MAKDVTIPGQSNLGFSIAVFPTMLPEGGLAEIMVRVSEPQGSGERILDEIHKTILVEVGATSCYYLFCLDILLRKIAENW